MVDALDAAAGVLRRRGVLIDARPAVEPRLSLSLRAGARRVPLGPIETADPGLAAARLAARRVIREGRFELVSRTRRRVVARYGAVDDLRWLDRVNDSWSLSPAVLRRARSAWRRSAGPRSFEIDRTYSLTVLRKRPAGRFRDRGQPPR